MNEQNKLTGKELGMYLGILVGIAVLQTSEQLLGLAILPIIGFAFGLWLDHLTRQINRQGWLEGE